MLCNWLIVVLFGVFVFGDSVGVFRRIEEWMRFVEVVGLIFVGEKFCIVLLRDIWN